MKKTMAAILQEVLAEDKTLLTRRKELIDALDKKVPQELNPEYNTIFSALEDANVGDIFAKGEFDNNREAAKNEVVSRLKKIGMPDTSINFVLQTFELALEWDKPPLNPVPEINTVDIVEESVIPEEPVIPAENFENTSHTEDVETEPVQKIEFEEADEASTFNEKISDNKSREENTSSVGENRSRSSFLIPAVILAAAALIIYMFLNRAPEPEVEPPVDESYLNAKTDLSLNGIDLGIGVDRLKAILGEEKFFENRGDHDFYKYDNLDVEVREDKSARSPRIRRN